MSVVKASTTKEPSILELKNRTLSRRAAREGFVLLENNGVLPLKENRIALYGPGARMTVKGGTGSGAVRERYSVNICEGLKNAGFEIASEAWLDRFDNYYDDTYESYRQEQEKKVEGVKEFYRILGMVTPFAHPTGIPITEEDVAAANCGTAIYVLARQAGEGNDREDRQGDYRLDDIELENIRFLSEHYKNLIVIINAGGVVDLGFLDRCRIAALVYFVQGGEEGGNALADLLTGKENFSGRLATSWAYGFEDIPSNATYSYLGLDPYQQEYNEGIYLGYRYFDSFRVKPRYCFGYGLSYTCFAVSCERVDGLCVTVKVKNTGSCAGREVIQLYASVPFGAQGSEYQRLAAFAKTAKLAPGEDETLTLEIPVKQLAVYEEASSRWLLRAGDYILRLGNNSRDTAPIVVLTLPQEVTLEQCEAVCPPQHVINELHPPQREGENLSMVRHILWEPAVEPVNHTYNTPEEVISPLVRSLTNKELAMLICGGGTSPKNPPVLAMGASGTTAVSLYESRGIPNAILSDGPAGLNLTSQIVELPDGSFKAACVPENLEAYKRYMFGIAGMGLRMQMADPSEGTVHYQYATAWPCSQLLAQSWDTSLLCEVGDAVGAEMEAFGVSVWLAPGMNLHRNPLCGRTFEYFSEDPLISGKMAAAIVRGVQRHPGKGMSVKHFAANNCELNRNESSSNLTERTLRELYLRGFEIAVKESAPLTVMAAYNKINGVYCTNNYDLLAKVLRCEWGFEGLVMSDWDSMKAERSDCMSAATGDVLKAPEAQCDLICPGRPDQIEALTKALEQGFVDRDDMERSAERILNLIRKNTVLSIKE